MLTPFIMRPQILSNSVCGIGINQTARPITGRIGRLHRPRIPIGRGLAVFAKIKIEVDALVCRVVCRHEAAALPTSGRRRTVRLT